MGSLVDFHRASTCTRENMLTGERLAVNDIPLFTHSAIDDYGLTLAQHRLVCRIARRGVCVESVPNMARGCLMHPDTAWSALRFLLGRGLITKKSKPGSASCYTVSPLSAWIPTGKQGAPESEGHPSASTGGTGKEGAGTHRKRRGTKVLPTRYSLKIPTELDRPDFKLAWSEWEGHKRAMRKTITPQGASRQIATLAEWGAQRAIAAIHYSIEKGWQGIFEPRTTALSASKPTVNEAPKISPTTTGRIDPRSL